MQAPFTVTNRSCGTPKVLGSTPAGRRRQRSRLVECAPIFGALVHNAPLSALLSAQCALSAPKAPVTAPINDQVAPSFLMFLTVFRGN